MVMFALLSCGGQLGGNRGDAMFAERVEGTFGLRCIGPLDLQSTDSLWVGAGLRLAHAVWPASRPPRWLHRHGPPTTRRQATGCISIRPCRSWPPSGRYAAGAVGNRRGFDRSPKLAKAALPAPEFGQVLLDVKFAVPPPRPGAVSRAGLVKTARSSDCRIVAITAPAGYGKSTFLAEWAAAEDRRVAWVSLDRFDDDPGMLLVLLASAYCQAGLGDADLVADIRGPGVSVLGRAAPRLASALHASPV